MAPELRTTMPRAKRERMLRKYQKIRDRVAEDIERSNATRIGALAGLIATRSHLDRVIAQIEAGLH